ncbi:hypothetical protein [Acidovorax sp. sic0104]|uniref:hypothetical protein n=1 Tax=Acidovorax sp. sic0104 TaxID=2854784 RepID=UPI001C453159|nr:hypothetical protein [Acidovorax sp. sic0104]MBV7542873.1 hypothetical protein [Acidovorax sp. sic0104]
MIGQLHLKYNDVDFRYIDAAWPSGSPAYAELRVVLDVSRFFSRCAHHVILALDCAGEQGSNNPHCGPIYRDGQNLFSTARGAILLGDGTVMTEVWNGTFSPELAVIPNLIPGPFDPSAHRCLNVRVRCDYAGGTSVRIRDGRGGPVLFAGMLATAAWPYEGEEMRACLGGIALGFVPPKDTGCVEQIAPRSAPHAVLGYAASARVA